MSSNYCYGCNRSVEELISDYNHTIQSLNTKYNTKHELLKNKEDLMQEPEIIFTDFGEWYCHPDCLKDSIG